MPVVVVPNKKFLVPNSHTLASFFMHMKAFHMYKLKPGDSVCMLLTQTMGELHGAEQSKDGIVYVVLSKEAVFG